MMKGTYKRISAVVLGIIALIMIMPTGARAAGNIDTEAHSTLSVVYQFDAATPINGAQFDLYRVADVDKYGDFTLTKDFASYPVNLEGLDSEGWMDLAETLRGYVLRDSVSPFDTGKTDARGKLIFPVSKVDMKPGLYLLVGYRRTIGDYTYTCLPSMVAIPAADKESNTWVYDVTVYPKYMREEKPPESDDKYISRKVYKVWADSKNEKERPQEVVVQLLRDGKVYDTVTLSARNNWRYAWDNLSRKYEWTVVEKEVKNYKVSVSKEGISYIITNTYDVPPPPPPPYIPQTGMLWWPVPILAGVGLFLFVMGYIRRRRDLNDD